MLNDAIQWNAQYKEHPSSYDENNQDGHHKNGDACLRGRSNQLVNFALWLERENTEVVVGVIVVVDQVFLIVGKFLELRLGHIVVARINVLDAKFRNFVGVREPSLQVRVVKDFALSVDGNQEPVFTDFVIRECGPQSAEREACNQGSVTGSAI